MDKYKGLTRQDVEINQKKVLEKLSKEELVLEFSKLGIDKDAVETFSRSRMFRQSNLETLSLGAE